MIYKSLFGLMQKLDPEFAHWLGLMAIRVVGLGVVRPLVRKKSLPKETVFIKAMGLSFSSPIGLAAGFDKNGKAVAGLGALGFGFVEIGTVTPLPQVGNSKPRLFRLPEDQALVNRMGFNNDGAQVVAQRLAQLKKGKENLPTIGVNIGKNRDTPSNLAPSDYAECASLLAPVADYLVVNVSSPNTPGLRDLQSRKPLKDILVAVKKVAAGTPVLVKISPDLESPFILEVAKLVMELSLAGVVASNSTISRPDLSTSASRIAAIGAGGLSGAPLRSKALATVRELRSHLPRKYCIIGVGGISDGASAREMLEAGADLIQGYTGFVYRGPRYPYRLMNEMNLAA